MATSDNEQQRVVQQMTTSGTTSDNAWNRVATNNNELYKKWQRALQRVTTNENKWEKNDNYWQQMMRTGTANKKVNKSKKNRVISSFKMKQKANLVPGEFSQFFMQYLTTI